MSSKGYYTAFGEFKTISNDIVEHMTQEEPVKNDHVDCPDGYVCMPKDIFNSMRSYIDDMPPMHGDMPQMLDMSPIQGDMPPMLGDMTGTTLHSEDGHGAMHSEDGHGAMHSEDENFHPSLCCYGGFRCDHEDECHNVDLDKCGSNDWPEKTDYDCTR